MQTVSSPSTAFKRSVEINSLSRYIEYVKHNFSSEEITLFRGQQQDFSLLPKIARIKPKEHVLKTEKRMLEELKRRSIPYLSIRFENEWDWLALAQHHGLATRLLDWTMNPLTALWFAVAKPPKDDDSGVIWAYQPDQNDIVISKEESSPFTGIRTEVFQPDHITSRIVSQGGWFTVHKFQPANKEKGSPEKFIPLEKLRRAKPRLKKLLIPPRQFAQLRLELGRCGIDSSFIYPGLDGVCRHVQWANTYLDDEHEMHE